MRILICDDHELFRYGLRMAIEELDGNFQVEEASDIASTRACILAGDLDLLLLDLDLPDGSGNELLTLGLQQTPPLRVVVISACDSQQAMREVMAKGAQGFIPKSHSKSILVSALQIIANGGQYVPPAALLTPNTPDANGPSLSGRQREVLQLVAKGLSNQEIAELLAISPQTVKVHVKLALATLGAANRAEAASLALKKGLL